MNDSILLELGNQHQLKYEESSLFQREGYNKIATFLRETQRKFKTTEEKDWIADCRFHDAILIEGERGSGKSVFLYNLNNTKAFPENDRDILGSFKFLDMIDPTLLSGTKDIISSEAFCSVLVGLIHECVTREKNLNGTDLRDYFKHFKDVAESLASLKNIREEVGIDAIYANQNALKLEQNLHIYLQSVSNLYEGKQLVLRIDDVDMAFANGFHVLETVRKYLASPYILPIVSGDFRLYKLLVKKDFQEPLKTLEVQEEREEREARDSQSRQATLSRKISLTELSEKYLVKVLPSDRQLKLHSLPELLRKYSFQFKIEKSQYDLKSIQQILDDLFNHGIRQTVYRNTTLDFSKEEDPAESKANISCDSLRLWIQFHEKMSPVYQEWSSQKAEDAWFKLYKDFQQRLYDFFIGLDQFNDTATFAGINLVATGEAESDRFDYRIALKQLVYMPRRKIPCEGEGEYDKSKKLLSSPLSYLNSDSHADRAVKQIRKFKDYDRFLLQLFVYNNYYTMSHRRPWLLFAGRFVEFVFATMNLKYRKDGKFDWPRSFEDNKSILYATPLFSLFDREKKLEEILSANEEAEPDVKELDLLEDLSMEDVLNSFTSSNKQNTSDDTKKAPPASENAADTNSNILFADAHFLHQALNRFFSNLEVLRFNYKLDGEALHHYMLRCAYMLLNAVAACETKGRVALQNIALMDHISNETIEKKDNCYNKNIAPLLNEDTLTAQLHRHPVIDMILKMGDDHYDGELSKLKLGVDKLSSHGPQKTFKQQAVDSKDMNDLLDILTQWKNKDNEDFKKSAQNLGPLTALCRALKKHGQKPISSKEKARLLELTGWPEEKLTQFRM